MLGFIVIFIQARIIVDADTPKTNPLTITRHTNFRYGCAGLDQISEMDVQL
jgi:hypothetical protein